MMRRKNLERAIVLGLLLSTSVYGNVWAETLTDFKNEAEDGTITVTEDTVVDGTGGSLGYGDTANSIYDVSIEIADGVTLELKNVNATKPNITGNGNIVINTDGTGPIVTGAGDGYIQANNMTIDSTGGGMNSYGGTLDVDLNGELNITSDNIGIHAQMNGEHPEKASIINIDADKLVINAANRGIYLTNADVKQDITITLQNGANITSTGTYAGIQNSNANAGVLSISSENGSIIVNDGSTGAWVTYGSVTNLSADSIELNGNDYGILNNNNSTKNGFANISLISDIGNNKVIGNSGIRNNAGEVKLEAKNGTNEIYAATYGLNVDNSANTHLIANNNKIQAGNIENNYGDKKAINALSGSSVILNAGLNNSIYGAVYATGVNTTIDITKFEEATSTFSRSGNGEVSNYVYSAAVIDGAGDLAGKTTTENGDGTVTTSGMDVVSALYAEEGAQINLSGVNDIQTYYGDPKDEHTSERAVWAYKGANITLDGVTNISTYAYEVSPENRDIAIAAGTATELKDKDFEKDVLDNLDIATVNLNYQAGSSISGDILAAYGGEVRITDANPATKSVARSDAATGINITGDLLAGNTGKLTVDLGNGGSLTGRADDYGDASTEHITLYNPAFSSNIIQGGDVTLNMGDGSQWNVQGQSWITNVNATGNVLIDLTSAENQYKNYDSHALTIRNLNGDANIKMDLNGDRSQSDMLYIGQGKGEYNIELANLVKVSDMYAEGTNSSGETFEFSGLRFATVGMGSDVKFNVTAKGQGFNNVRYTVGTDEYNSTISEHENDAYNGGNDTTLEKPGNDAVEDILKDVEQAQNQANQIMLLAEETEPANDNATQHLNYKLIAMESDGFTDAGKTVLNMSRANYSNAIYMDRLNKRLGEARYINDDPEEDEGMWVRIRHDRIGKEDAFRSQNTMYELGYDKRQECDNGKRRVGFAVDYMHGDTGYSDIAGKGEIDRYGLWLYDTWTGNKGHYVDYVAKWGHLDNDFEVYNMGDNKKVTGDYSNNVFSISAEYGRKKDMGNDWYIEPQAQLQLARVTGADYTTSQGTKVSVDGINSLIGRAGFRLGKDFGEEKQSTVYFKADVLHEFLGDQTIRAMDGTTDGWQTVDYENKGTWYDIGIGYAAMLSQSTYAFIDLEQSFGNDNDDTYQINAGVRWTF